MDAGDDAERNPQHRGDQQRGDRQLERRRQALSDVEADRAMRILAFAKIKLQHLAEIEQQLLRDRPVETVLVAYRLDLLRRGIVSGQRGRRIGRHDPDQHERDDQQPEQRGDRVERPPQEEFDHR